MPQDFCNPAERLSEHCVTILSWDGATNNKNHLATLSYLISEYYSDKSIDIFREMRRHCDTLISICPSIAYDSKHSEWWLSELDSIDEGVDALHLEYTANFFIGKFMHNGMPSIFEGMGHSYRVRHESISSAININNISEVLSEIDELLNMVSVPYQFKRQIARDLEKIRDILRLHETHSLQDFAIAYNKVSQAISSVVAIQDTHLQVKVKHCFPKWRAMAAITFFIGGVLPQASNLTTIASAYNTGFYDDVVKGSMSYLSTEHSSPLLIEDRRTPTNSVNN
jgi:hypothetical protein